MREEEAQIIKAAVSLTDAFAKYGIDVDGRGFALCPFHGEKTPSFHVTKDGAHYHCFGCGAHGDVIALVRGLFGLSFSEAISRLQADFGLTASSDYRSRQMAGRAVFEAKKALRKKQEEREQIEAEFFDALDDYELIQSIIKRHAPTDPNEPPQAIFWRALKERDYIQERLDRAEERRIAYANDNTNQ